MRFSVQSSFLLLAAVNRECVSTLASKVDELQVLQEDMRGDMSNVDNQGSSGWFTPRICCYRLVVDENGGVKEQVNFTFTDLHSDWSSRAVVSSGQCHVGAFVNDTKPSWWSSGRSKAAWYSQTHEDCLKKIKRSTAYGRYLDLRVKEAHYKHEQAKEATDDNIIMKKLFGKTKETHIQRTKKTLDALTRTRSAHSRSNSYPELTNTPSGCNVATEAGPIINTDQDYGLVQPWMPPILRGEVMYCSCQISSAFRVAVPILFTSWEHCLPYSLYVPNFEAVVKDTK